MRPLSCCDTADFCLHRQLVMCTDLYFRLLLLYSCILVVIACVSVSNDSPSFHIPCVGLLCVEISSRAEGCNT